jgi:predicted nucleic acid-binding Zn ribbon protein
MQSMSEPPKDTCEKCGGKLTRVISPSGFILKGGGWYKDLYSKPPGGGDKK